MASLENQPVNTTYQSIVKLSDNGTVPASVGEQLSDGLGNPIPMKVSTNSVQFTAACQVQTPTLADHATRKDYVDSADSTLQANINQVENDLTDLINNEEAARITADSTLQNNIDNLELIDLADTPSTYGTAGQVLATNSGANGTEWITVSGGGGGAVDSVNSLTGAIDIVSTDLDLLTVSTNGQDIELNPILPRTMLEDIINVSGSAIQKGQALHITGSNGNAAEVVLADSSLGLAAHLICFSNTIANGNTGQAVAVGFIGNVSVADTTNFQAGTHVYLSTGGGFTHIRPTGTNIVQYLGVVLNASTTSGAGTISGIIQNLGVENELPNLPLNHVWEGNLNGVPQAVNQNTLNVASAVTAQQATSAVSSQTSLYADDAANVKIDAVGSGTFRVILGDDGQGSGAYQRLKSDVGNGFTYNPSGDVVSAGAFTSVNAITAGGALIGGALDISGNADIDGTLTLGGIGNVENEINQNTSDIAALQAIPQVAPIVNETATITISDDTYNNKFVVFDGAVSVDAELDNIQAWQPTVGTEIYFMSVSGDVSIVSLGPNVLVPSGKNETSRGTNSVIGIKCIDAGSLPTTESTWVLFGDLA